MNHGGPRYAGRGHPNNRGRSPRSTDNSTYRPRHAGGEEPSVAGSSNPSSGAFRGRISHQMTPRNFRNQFVQKQASSSEQRQWRPVNSKKDASPGAVDLQQEHSSADDMSNTSKQLLGSIASNSDSYHTSNTSSAQNVSKSLHSAVERIQIREPIAEGGSCSDSLPYDNCNRSAVEQGLVVQVPLESCAKDESSTIKSRENNVSDCKDSENKKPSVTLDPFDICPPKSGVVTLEPSLLANNREPIAEGGSCSDSLPYDNCNKSTVEQGLVVQVPLESCAKDESSTIKSRENNVSDCKDSEDKKPSVTLDPFDICPPKSGVVTLEPSLLANNKEPIAEGGSCSDSLPYDNCNKSAVEQGLVVQGPLESCAKDESSTIKSRENNVSDCKDSEDKKPSVTRDPFDICPPKSGVVTLEPSLLANNREPIAEGGSCSDSLSYDNCNKSAVEQGLVVQGFPLESCAKDESSTIKSRENNVSDCMDSEDKKLSVTLDPFDICPPKSGVVTLEPSLLANNKEPIAEGGSCSDSLPYDNCNKSAVEQGLVVQVPLESCAKDESSTIKSRENNVSDCMDSEDKKPSVNLDPFDTCPPKSGVVTPKPSLLANNREPIAEGGSCSDSLPCNKSAVEQRLVVQVPLESCAKDESSTIKSRENNVSDCKDLEDKKPSVNLDPFDICPPKSGVVTLKPSFLAKNREKRNEMKRAREGNSGIVLRPGMVHLKSCISLRDQVNIVKICRELGIRAGGFYKPGYREGGKLHLKMMCLGKNWDPDSSTYGDVRPFDDTKPPGIPDEFYQLVEKAIKDSYAIMMKDSTAKNPERVLPWMKPNICIVNFYSQNGRLGLHQDRDESQESLDKGLPVVSFSIGDSADFLFGDRNDADQAEKVTLKSGDILIFGGKSRHVFHGVTAIHPNTAPGALLDETNLRSGRLNLTFRQF